MNWQPIETAPVGTRVLIKAYYSETSEETRIVEAYLHKGEWFDPRGYRVGFYATHWASLSEKPDA